MAVCERSRILIFGATGYLGKYMVKASVSLGFPTFAYVRPIRGEDDPKKMIHQELAAMGVTIFHGGLDEHDKLVDALRQVDVVISTLAVPQHLDQLKLVDAMKEASNIKRFVPSEYGNEVDRSLSPLPPFRALLDNKKKIRRATEAAGIPHTYVSANTFSAYFVDYMLHPREKGEEVVLYGTGEAKTVWNYEEDVATYTVKASTDPRARDRVLIIRPPGNIASQMDVLAYWEEKTKRTLNKIHLPAEKLVELSETLPHPDNIPIAILHNIFIKGDQVSFELTEDDLEASKMYPDYKYTSIYKLLDTCLVNPPKAKLATFC